MASKYIYLGQDWEIEDLNTTGFGSVYLAGPRNPQKDSWRLDFIKKVEKKGLSLTYLIPETKEELNGGRCNIDYDDKIRWEDTSIACATAIVFWFPLKAGDMLSLVEFGNWYKSERVFLGGDPGEDLVYLDYLLHKEQKIHAVNTIDQLVERFIHWIMA